MYKIVELCIQQPLNHIKLNTLSLLVSNNVLFLSFLMKNLESSPLFCAYLQGLMKK